MGHRRHEAAPQAAQGRANQEARGEIGLAFQRPLCRNCWEVEMRNSGLKGNDLWKNLPIFYLFYPSTHCMFPI